MSARYLWSLKEHSEYPIAVSPLVIEAVSFQNLAVTRSFLKIYFLFLSVLLKLSCPNYNANILSTNLSAYFVQETFLFCWGYLLFRSIIQVGIGPQVDLDLPLCCRDLQAVVNWEAHSCCWKESLRLLCLTPNFPSLLASTLLSILSDYNYYLGHPFLFLSFFVALSVYIDDSQIPVIKITIYSHPKNRS